MPCPGVRRASAGVQSPQASESRACSALRHWFMALLTALLATVHFCLRSRASLYSTVLPRAIRQPLKLLWGKLIAVVSMPTDTSVRR